jgi:hypothetical protein
VEPLFQAVPHPLGITLLRIGLGAAPVLTLVRTIRPQLQWAAPSRKQQLSLIIDANSCGVVRGSNERMTQPTKENSLRFLELAPARSLDHVASIVRSEAHDAGFLNGQSPLTRRPKF